MKMTPLFSRPCTSPFCHTPEMEESFFRFSLLVSYSFSLLLASSKSKDESSSSTGPHRAKGEDVDNALHAKDRDREGGGEGEYVKDVQPEVWTGDDKWPKLGNPPMTFPSKDVDLVLSQLQDGTNVQAPARIVQVPAHIAKYLLPYQREGVRFLYDKYSQDTGCILGDDMGLGKTTQTTAFLIAILGKHGTSADICTTTVHARKQGKKRPVLICCPASIMNQWMSELLVWSFFHVRICPGPNDDAIVDMALQGEIEIVILSFETYRGMSDRLNPVDWEVVIFDEAQMVNNESSKLSKAANGLKCKRRVGLTGTLLQNNMKVAVLGFRHHPLVCQPSTVNFPGPSSLNPKPQTPKPKTQTSNPKP